MGVLIMAYDEKRKYKLYNYNTGYKCQVNNKELIFLFGSDATGTIEEINNTLYLYGYYIK